jgi:hypothetical protein
MYTRDHPQRQHEHFELHLEDVAPAVLNSLPPDSVFGTGYTLDDFVLGQQVETWLAAANQWWKGKVTYKSQKLGTLSLKLAFEDAPRSGIFPKMCRPVNRD